MKEEWRPVSGYEGIYEVSSLGNVASLNYRCTGRRETLRPGTVCGYPVVLLCFGNHQKQEYVHRLVAEAFIPHQIGRPQVNHIDGNKGNNSVDNIEWCTPQENMRHAARHGLVSTEKAWMASVKKSSVPVEQLDELGDVIRTFPSASSAAKAVGAGHSAILSCATGKREFAGGYRWRLAEGGAERGRV